MLMRGWTVDKVALEKGGAMLVLTLVCSRSCYEMRLDGMMQGRRLNSILVADAVRTVGLLSFACCLGLNDRYLPRYLAKTVRS